MVARIKRGRDYDEAGFEGASTVEPSQVGPLFRSFVGEASLMVRWGGNVEFRRWLAKLCGQGRQLMQRYWRVKRLTSRPACISPWSPEMRTCGPDAALGVWIASDKRLN